MKTSVEYSDRSYKMAIAKSENMQNYIKAAMNCDEEANYYTGSFETFTEKQIEEFFLKCLEDDSRYDFLIFDENKIIGEVVLNEIDSDVKSAHFRICIFYSEYFNKGIGSFATKSILNFAFDNLSLQRVGLEVFSYNDRAMKVYEKSGFVVEGKLRNAILNKNEYAHLICMSILKDEYEALYNKK